MNLFTLAVLFMGVVFSSCKDDNVPPDEKSDKAGTCSKCGMALVKKEDKH